MDAAVDAAVDVADAAVRLVADGGVAALVPPAVDVAAGLPPGTCARIFPDRAGLLVAVLDRATNPIEEAQRRLIRAADGDPVEYAVAAIQHLLGPARDRSRAVFCLILDPEVRRTVGVCADALVAGWTRLLAAGTGLPLEASARWVRIIYGFAFLGLVTDEPAPEPAALRHQLTALHVSGSPG
jgi:hypothetical protein